jgi:uncharacterized protein (DUF2267 family)
MADLSTPKHHVVVEVQHFDAAIGMIGDQVEGLRGELHTMRQELPGSMAAAFQAALTDPVMLGKIIGTVADIAQKRAAEKTGNAVGAALKSIFTKWLLIGCTVALVAKLAGVDVARVVWSAFTK